MGSTRSVREISVRASATLGSVAGVLALLACGSASDADGARVPAALRYHVVTSGSVPDDGRGGGARGRLVRSRARAVSVLRAWDLERAIGAAGKVDYARRSLVIVLGSSVPDSAYRLSVTRLSVRSRRLRARARVARPAGAMGAMAISRPYTLVSVDRDDVAGAGAVVDVTVSGP